MTSYIEIKIRIFNPTKDLINCIKKDLYAERDENLEEYDWELIGEDDHVSGLQRLSILIDSCKLVEHDEYTEIILIRNK